MIHQLREKADTIYKGTLPKTCLLRLAVSEISVENKNAGQGVKKKHGKGQLEARIKECLIKHPKWTAKQIAENVGNTTPAAVRQTVAWKERPNKPKKKK
ncbi:hypothetical protein ACFL6U_26380 [Planctomycetota bacterium]